MIIHFEELWEKCENLHKEYSEDDSVSEIIAGLSMKLELYSAIDQKSEISLEDVEKAKSRLMGEILLSLTALSLKDNINVFDALNIAQMQYSIGLYSTKYQS
jgi:hypothetical protein